MIRIYTYDDVDDKSIPQSVLNEFLDSSEYDYGGNVAIMIPDTPSDFELIDKLVSDYHSQNMFKVDDKMAYKIFIE
jgi:hypothetical protein